MALLDALECNGFPSRDQSRIQHAQERGLIVLVEPLTGFASLLLPCELAPGDAGANKKKSPPPESARVLANALW